MEARRIEQPLRSFLPLDALERLIKKVIEGFLASIPILCDAGVAGAFIVPVIRRASGAAASGKRASVRVPEPSGL